MPAGSWFEDAGARERIMLAPHFEHLCSQYTSDVISMRARTQPDVARRAC